MKKKTPFVDFDELPIPQQHEIIKRLELEIPDLERRKWVLARLRVIPK